MDNRSHIDIAKVFAEVTPIEEALEESAREAAIEHKRAGLPLVVWDRKRNRVAYIPPEAINDDGTVDGELDDDEIQP